MGARARREGTETEPIFIYDLACDELILISILMEFRISDYLWPRALSRPHGHSYDSPMKMENRMKPQFRQNNPRCGLPAEIIVTQQCGTRQAQAGVTGYLARFMPNQKFAIEL
jgi:hypothetical protein